LTAGAGNVGNCIGNPARCAAVNIAAGYYHTAALKADGTVWTWGSNANGQLGDNSTTQRNTPVKVGALGGITTAVSAGVNFTVALRQADSTVWSWGYNGYGQLGDNTIMQHSVPVKASGLSTAFAVTAGGYHVVVLNSDYSASSWGNNVNGQLGDGTTLQDQVPAPVSGMNSFTAVAAGGSHTVALKSDGTVWTWGRDAEGQLGDGMTGQRVAPWQVTGLSGVTAVTAGSAHTVALMSDGTVRAWGRNAEGQLGDGTTIQRLTPVQIGGLNNVTALAGGVNYTLALKSDGTVWAWGYNGFGQLGDSTTVQRLTPVQVKLLPGAVTVAVTAGSFHAAALNSDGTIWTWGGNSYGQLGDGTTIQRLTPVSVSGLNLLSGCGAMVACNAVSGVCDVPSVANGTPCDDSNLCTKTDVCLVGVCGGSNPVNCQALDQCHTAGTCTPATGKCSNLAAADGTICDDGSACTQKDICQAGICTGTNPIVCAPLDQCHMTGTCNAATGMCSNPPKADTYSCDDGNACTHPDTCQLGACIGVNPVICAAPDQCHTLGTCNSMTGKCSNPMQVDGAMCNDGDACSQMDTCQSGVCTGSTTIICPDPDQCHKVGTCNPATGLCSNPAKAPNSPCDDGNACTKADSCQAGTCTGKITACDSPDDCHETGTCDPQSGACWNAAKPDGSSCSVGKCLGATCIPSRDAGPDGGSDGTPPEATIDLSCRFGAPSDARSTRAVWLGAIALLAVRRRRPRPTRARTQLS
jgi:alpha-tubulin suppressor-like RCC1 family protein